MKLTKLAQAISAAALLTASASSAMADAAPSEKIRLFYDSFVKNDPALLDQVLAPDWVDIPPNPGQAPGREAFKPYVANANQTFTDMKMTNEDIITSGNKVVVRSTFEATQTGAFAGFPAKNRPIKIMTIDIHEFNKDGLVSKTWHLEDWLGGLFQMGAFEK